VRVAVPIMLTVEERRTPGWLVLWAHIALHAATGQQNDNIFFTQALVEMDNSC
jgi:hypothetical protein